MAKEISVPAKDSLSRDGELSTRLLTGTQGFDYRPSRQPSWRKAAQMIRRLVLALAVLGAAGSLAIGTLPASAAMRPKVYIEQNLSGSIVFAPKTIKVPFRKCSATTWAFKLTNLVENGTELNIYFDGKEAFSLSYQSTANVCATKAGTYTISGTTATLTVKRAA
jgi:hypothetical protein